MFWPNCLACGALGQELLNLYYPKGAILSQKLLNRELLNYRYLLYSEESFKLLLAARLKRPSPKSRHAHEPHTFFTTTTSRTAVPCATSNRPHEALGHAPDPQHS